MKLKPHNQFGNIMSENKEIIKSKNWFIDIQEYYGDCRRLEIRFWVRNKEDNVFILKKNFRAYLTIYGLYIAFIYPHLGKCHPNLRSKIYIGKPVEKSWNKE